MKKRTDSAIGRAALVAAVAVFAAVALSGPLFADTVTWRGPVSGGSWNDTANWTNTAGVACTPTASDSVLIPADIAVTSISLPSDAAIGGFTQNCATTLTISGEGKLTLGAAETKFYGAVGSHLILDCELTGSGRFFPMSMGTQYTLSRDNTFLGGLDSASVPGDSNDRMIRINLATQQSLGTAPSSTWIVIRTGVRLIFTSTSPITLPYTFYIPATFNNTRSMVFNGSVTFTGSVTFVDRASIGLVADMVCRFACPVTVNNPGKDYCMFWSGGVAFARRPQVIFEQTFTGRLFWHCGNCYNDIRFLSLGNAPGTFVNNDGVTCMLDDQFDETTQFVMGGSMYLDLNGHSQTLTKFWGSAGTLTNTAPTGAKLTLNYGGQEGNLAATAILNYYKGKVAGPLDFEWAPEGDYTYTFSNATWTAVGEVAVSAGTLRAVGQNWSTVTNLNVKGGTLSLEDSTTVGQSTKVHVADGGTLALNEAVALMVDEGVVRGVPLQRGRTYTGHEGALAGKGIELAGLSGLGTLSARVVEVPTVEAEWTGAGTDNFVSTARNWAGEEVPDLVSGGLVATVTGGSGMTFLADSTLKGIVFAGGGNPFTVGSSSASAALGVAYSGIAAKARQGIATNVVDMDLNILVDQDWDVEKNAVLEVRSDMSSAAGSIKKTGGGELHLRGDNRAYSGNLVTTSGVMHAWTSTAFGNPSVGRVESLRTTDSVRPVFALHDGVKIERLLSIKAHGNTAFEGAEVLALAGCRAEWAGTITHKGEAMGNGNLHLGAENGATLVISGGIDANWVMPHGTGDIVFTNTPFLLRSDGTYASFSSYNGDANGNVYFYTSGNMAKEVIGANGSRCKTHLMVPDVFSSSTALSLVTSSGGYHLYLHGNDQHFGNLANNASRPVCWIESDEPATLFVSQTKSAVTCRVPIVGKVSIVKSGSYALTFDGDYAGVTGRVEVTQGVLEFATAGAWANVTNFAASGSGTLKVSASEVFPRKADASVGVGAKLEIASGCVQTCGWLYLPDGGGVMRKQRMGVYSSAAGDGVNFVDAVHFSGGGKLVVRGDGGGTMLIFR